MVALKAIVVLAILGFSHAAHFEKFQSDKAMELLQEILDDIRDERERDQEVVNDAQTELDLATEAMNNAKKALDYAINAMNIAQKNLESQTTHLNVLKEEYSKAKQIRDQEQSTMTKLGDEIDQLNRIGGTSKKIGELDPVPEFSPSNELQVAINSLNDASARKPKLQDMLLQLGRGDASIPVFKSNIGNMADAVDNEEVEDKSRVTSQQAVVDAAQEVFDKKQAIRIAKQQVYDMTVVEHDVATKQLAHAKAEFEKADKTRKDDEALVTEMQGKMKELLAIRGGAGQTDLQVERKSETTDRLDKLLNDMIMYTEEEEETQLMMVNEAKALMEKKKAIMIQKDTLYRAAIENTNQKLKAMEMAKTALEAAQRALVIEKSTAIQERRMVSQLRQTIEKFKALKKMTGKCPIVDGRYCAGAGACVDDTCKCNDGHIGEDCSQCAFGYTMKNRVCVMSAETTSLGQYSAEEINTMLIQASRDYEQTAGIETLLGELLDKLDETQRQLEETRDKRQAEYDLAVQAWEFAKVQEAAAKKAFEVATAEYTAAKEDYDYIQALYNKEHPLRMAEIKTIGDMKNILADLTDNETYRMQAFTRPPAAGPAPAQ